MLLLSSDTTSSVLIAGVSIGVLIAVVMMTRSRQAMTRRLLGDDGPSADDEPRTDSPNVP